ncbi:MAG TPA: hypothetical protein VGF86_03935, partial [Candidatus Tumulicola sp.]
YSQESNDYQVAINHLHATSDDPKDGLWYALPDLVASVLLTGRVPAVVEAFRIVPKGPLPGLAPIRLRGTVTVDPRRQDFFRTVIEERKRLAASRELPREERARLDRALKVLANATSYGIFAEMLRQEGSNPVAVTCHGIDPKPFMCNVKNPEEPGEYCFPPLASLITSAARLMLALLERCVTDLGGTYAMEDTDSMAIVATKAGGLIECPGGTYSKDGNRAIKALGWEEVTSIASHFAQLNPYDRTIIPGSVLKIEDDSFHPGTKRQRQLWCVAISAKRYALFLRAPNGEPSLLRDSVNNKDDRYSEHGLGHLLNPTDPESDDRSWIAQAWDVIVRRSLGLSTKPFGFETRPAVGRITVSSPAVMKAFKTLNAGKPYAKQVKPFNFILSCHVRPLGHPIGVDPEQFHLIAPYEKDPRHWEKMDWIDQYSKAGKRYRISATAPRGSRTLARAKSFGDVLREYEYHPEAKCTDSTGKPCGRQSVGLLGRSHVSIDSSVYIGKESNRLEEVAEQTLTDPTAAYTVYSDPQRDEWETKILPRLKAPGILREACEETGISRAQMQRYRNKNARPHAEHLRAIKLFLARRRN